MAGGKSKSKASEKKTAAEATSSAPQPFPYLDGSFLEFGSEEELTRFITYFAKRPISPPRVLPELYPQQKGGAPTIHSAPPEKRLLLYIITRILRPRDSSHTSLSNKDLRVVHAIIHGASINWAKYVMIHMTDCASIATERSLPYAFLVMDLIVSADIHIAGPDTKMTKLWLIQDSTFRKKSGDQTGAGPSRARAPPPAHAPAPARASLQSIADTLNRLTVTVDGMGQYLERMDSSIQRQGHDMRAYFRGINYVLPPFDSTFLGQNYEGEDEDDNSYAPSSSPDEADFEDAVDGDPMDVEDDEEDDDTEDEDAAA
ncbi:unnamed protein product [Cuscuta campestris]|uniref:Uncharacterized protein n=1 Tax=Cuscuta campestris TaxID=132261 RepID=A0A484LNP3_9ASTE|nr:unnamed protein product [Cuscuta campestris]